MADIAPPTLFTQLRSRLRWAKVQKDPVLIEVKPKPRPHDGKLRATSVRGVQSMEAALTELAMLCTKHNIRLTLVAVGNGVLPFFLNQGTLLTIDIVYELVPAENKKLLNRFVGEIAEKYDTLPRNWLNNGPRIYMEPEVRDILGRESLRYGKELFCRPGLVVWIPPWKYFFVAKIDELSQRHLENLTGDEMANAATYLSLVLREESLKSVSFDKIARWHLQYHKPTRPGFKGVCDATNIAYQRSYHRKPIIK
ncbi:hypothetical protein FH972_023566 [Carpinus fangiana]|uniref:Uncharacterized protein n=1 Tax=Carpinus fangiana TaxID=176857 RepID=A0A5N6KXT5_9ROSI|nr:hypothetical protein FH972_023566 [Carpinus fangiana]